MFTPSAPAVGASEHFAGSPGRAAPRGSPRAQANWGRAGVPGQPRDPGGLSSAAKTIAGLWEHGGISHIVQGRTSIRAGKLCTNPVL